MDGDIVEIDVLVVGSEGAGARASIEASKLPVKVAIATKGRVGKCGATMTAGCDFTVDGRSLEEVLGLEGDLRDSPGLFMKEIVADGGFLNNQKVVEAYVRDGPLRVKELIDWGMKITGVESAHGQEYRRGIRSNGRYFVETLRSQIKNRRIDVVEDTMVLDLIIRDGRVAGATALNLRTGEFIVFRAKAIVLATGGWQMAYLRTSATDDLTGDGQAMAYRAGAELVDMEMVEFMPVPVQPKGWERQVFFPMLSEILLHAYLLNADGERFMDHYDPTGRYRKGGHVPISFIAMESEVAAGRGSPHGGVYLTIENVAQIDKLIDKARNHKIPGFADFLDWFEVNKTMEVAVGAHFHCGGIVINEKCETNIRGLYAAGECAGGLWGGNRVAAATTQVVVQGAIAGRFAAEYAHVAGEVDLQNLGSLRRKVFAPVDRREGVSPIELRKLIQSLASEKLGVIRVGSRLREAVKELEEVAGESRSKLCATNKSRLCNQEWLEALQLENMIQCLEMSAKSALMREESRMSHYRDDFPFADNDNWLRNIVVRRVNGIMELATRPVIVTKVPLPTGKWTYEQVHAKGSWAEQHG